MIGYHYTSWDNWLRIKKEGLIPYTINHSNLNELGISRGIWLFLNRQEEESHFGTILFQVCSKNSWKIVMLKVEYNYDDRAMAGKSEIDLSHTGTLNDIFVYHRDIPSRIILKVIPPSQIRLEKSYDLAQLLAS